MTVEEYINEHPEKFVDAIDKWLFTEFSIVGGCCSAQGSMEYSVARMVAEKMKQQMIDKAVRFMEEQDEMIGISFQQDFIERYKKAMEE